MTFTGVLNTLGDGTLQSTTSILGGSTGLIIVGMLALGVIGVLVYKFRHVLGIGK